MSGSRSTRPYLVRAIYEWCADNGYTPYLAVNVSENSQVPMEYVKDGQIVLNVGMGATRNLTLGFDYVQFSARFNGISQEVAVAMRDVAGIFARENGQGMFFSEADMAGDIDLDAEAEKDEKPDDEPPQPPRGRPKLQVVK